MPPGIYAAFHTQQQMSSSTHAAANEQLEQVTCGASQQQCTQVETGWVGYLWQPFAASMAVA
jgi:hypothetical protein